MGVPPLDPLTIPRLELSTGNGTNFGYSSNLTELVFVGGKDFKVKEAKVDLEKGIFNMVMYIPVFYVTGHYSGRGKVLLITFDGEGEMNTNFSEFTSLLT